MTKHFGIINQDSEFTIYDQDEHRPLLRVANNNFNIIVEWMYDHPGKYVFRDLEVVISQLDYDRNM